MVPDTARKRPRTTPKLKKKALTPGTVTRSARKRATHIDVLATPGGSNPTPRSLIQGLVNTGKIWLICLKCSLGIERQKLLLYYKGQNEPNILWAFGPLVLKKLILVLLRHFL